MKKVLALIWFVVLCCGFAMTAKAECSHYWTNHGNYKKVDDTYHSYDEVCEYCGETINHDVGVEEHNWGEFWDREKKDQTNHLIVYECSECGAIKKVAEQHDWKEKFDIYDGYEYKKKDQTNHLIVYECNRCGATKDVEEKHDWSYWSEYPEATCGEDGTISRECYKCGEKQTKKTPATGKHSWDEWEITKKATIKQAGQKKRTCYECGKEQTTSIAKLKPGVKFTKKKYTVNVRKKLKLKIKYSAGDSVKKFKSSNKKVVTVAKNGRIKAKRTGTAKITVIMTSGVKATCKIKVKAPKKKTSSGGSGTVYWTPGGSVYHKSRNCRTLKRSRTVYSGTIEESGKSRACKVCS